MLIMACFIWVVLVHVVLFQGIPEIAFVAEKELKPQINKQTNKQTINFDCIDLQNHLAKPKHLLQTHKLNPIKRVITITITMSG